MKLVIVSVLLLVITACVGESAAAETNTLIVQQAETIEALTARLTFLETRLAQLETCKNVLKANDKKLSGHTHLHSVAGYELDHDHPIGFYSWKTGNGGPRSLLLTASLPKLEECQS